MLWRGLQGQKKNGNYVSSSEADIIPAAPTADLPPHHCESSLLAASSSLSATPAGASPSPTDGGREAGCQGEWKMPVGRGPSAGEGWKLRLLGSTPGSGRRLG